jgi:RHH-type proline utilization regulon transcriptional repressor/proline dehydrogenase/delta 1-pyrroline-5-carboxylate dehydrogenase
MNEREEVASEAIALVESWLKESKRSGSRSPAEKRLAKILKDPKGLDWTLKFVDRVIRPSDRKVAAAELAKLSKGLPKSLGFFDRLAIGLGGLLAIPFSFIVIPIAKAVLRKLVGHLIADARPKKLTKHIAKAKSGGVSLNLNLLGEAVLGEEEANYRFNETFALLKRKDVDYVSIKLSAVASQLSMWGFEATVQRMVDKLIPIYEYAARSKTKKFINLDMEEYRDLGLTMLVFKKLLSKPELKNLEAGIVLQAYLPDSYEALKELTEFAHLRTLEGGAGIKVRIVKGANLAMELVDSEWHGWNLATYGTKADSDANYKRLIEYSLNPDRVNSLRVGIAGHNLFDLAYGHELSVRRGVQNKVEFEMLQGMAQHLSTQVKKSVGSLLLYTPVVRPSEFQVAVAYLTRRLEENGSPENFMSGVFDITKSIDVFNREKNRFELSIQKMADLNSAPNRKQNRLAETFEPSSSFENAPDTDTALKNNRDWVRQVLAGAASLQNNLKTHDAYIAEANLETYEVEEMVSGARAAAAQWSENPEVRKALLLRCGVELAKSRGALLQLMIAEGGKTIGEADAELSEAIDFANFYAHSIDEITKTQKVDGLDFIAHQLVVVTPPWNFPVAIAAGGVLAALAAGSSVIIKPAPQVVNCVLAMVDTLWRAGIPREVLRVALVPDNELGLHLVGHSKVDAVILTGAFETAKLFKSYRPRMQLAAETSGKNAIVISPFADLDLAAADLSKSAFGHAGQKCSAASLGILVGSVYENKQFLKQLVDAVSSMKVGYGPQSDATVGPLIEAPSEKLNRALTTLEPGESWLLEPKQLDDSGRLWRPGIKIGVTEGSFFHQTECFGPVLGLMKAKNLEHALKLQNGTEYGLTAGIHSLNVDEIKTWLRVIEAGNLYVNRGITGAIVERQPFGGFKRSSVGWGLKAGGRNYLLQFGRFTENSETLKTLTSPISDGVTKYIKEVEPVVDLDKDMAWLIKAASSDSHWHKELYGREKYEGLDKGSMSNEANYHRYLPLNNVIVRVSRTASKAAVSRIVMAAKLAGATIELSVAKSFITSKNLTRKQLDVLSGGYKVSAVEEENFNPVITSGTKLILVGPREARISELQENPDLFVLGNDVTRSGRITLLYLMREQSISITQHRFGAIQSEIVEILGSQKITAKEPEMTTEDQIVLLS